MAARGKASYPLLSYQPLRLLYQLYRVFKLLASLPLWFLLYLVPALRPHPEWTFKQALMARMVRAVVHTQSAVGITQTLSLKPGSEGSRFETITPFDAHLYQGPLASAPHVRPATIGGTWYPAKPTVNDPFQQGRIFLLLHGGAFVQGDGRQDWSGHEAKTLLETASGGTGAAVFAPQYRLSSYSNSDKGSNPFPAALQDCLTSYLYLTRTLGVPPRRLVLAGDSAGGNLVIALLRYLEGPGRNIPDLAELPLPVCAVAVAPWVDPLVSLGSDTVYTSRAQFSTDLLPTSFLRWGALAYTAGIDADGDEVLPYIKPLGHPFRTSVPLFVSLGELEMLEGAGTAWVEDVRRQGGCPWLEVSYEPRALHDTILVGDKVGWDESAKGVGRRIGDFISRVQAGQAGGQ
jgi:acetyl esterase/lipase